MNLEAVKSIYRFEMVRAFRTVTELCRASALDSALLTSFGSAIGSRITEIEGVSYGAFIVPGLVMLMLLTQSIQNASIGSSS